jgi:hypothetical protein
MWLILLLNDLTSRALHAINAPVGGLVQAGNALHVEPNYRCFNV